jgi:hypothetical protein
MEDSSNTEVPWLRMNLDEVPNPFWMAKQFGWCSDEAVKHLHAKREGSIWCDTPGHAKDYFTFVSTSTPTSMGVVAYLFKKNAPRGMKEVKAMQQKYNGKAIILREGTGYMSKELWNKRILKEVEAPTLDRVGRKTRIWKGAGNGKATAFWDGCGGGGHDLDERGRKVLTDHEIGEIPLLSRTSGHSQPDDQLHFVYKARYFRNIRKALGRSGDILEDQKDNADEDRTEIGNALRGLTIAKMVPASMDAWTSISLKNVLAAWMVTCNLTMD